MDVSFACNPRENALKPDICRFDQECFTTQVLSRKWQKKMMQAISDIWDVPVDDLDPVALILLLRSSSNGVRTLFAKANLEYLQ